MGRGYGRRGCVSGRGDEGPPLGLWTPTPACMRGCIGAFCRQEAQQVRGRTESGRDLDPEPPLQPLFCKNWFVMCGARGPARSGRHPEQSRWSVKSGRRGGGGKAQPGPTSEPSPSPSCAASTTPSLSLLPGIAPEYLERARHRAKCQTQWKARQRQPLPSHQATALSEPGSPPPGAGMRMDPASPGKGGREHFGDTGAPDPQWEGGV